MGKRLDRDFFRRDVLEVAPDLLGRKILRAWPGGKTSAYVITETEAYRGGEDLACHASRGRTPRTEVMFGDGGHVYMYLIYGIHWMLNVVTATEGIPQAVLIRGLQGVTGPGRLTRELGLGKEFYGTDLVRSSLLWMEEGEGPVSYASGPRVGIDYAGDPWKDMPWRFRSKA
ncbi:MAG: DNA-3-methyladenine glycosylase [Bacteroidales bacterium]